MDKEKGKKGEITGIHITENHKTLIYFGKSQ